MAITVADFLVERLIAWKVPRVFGYPGDGINGILGALNRARDRLPFIRAYAERREADGSGAAFGTTVWLAADEIAIPLLGLSTRRLGAPSKCICNRWSRTSSTVLRQR